jgi:hypothetical protein
VSDWLKEVFLQSINRLWLILHFFIEVEAVRSSTIASLRGQPILLWFWVVVDDFGDEFRVFLFVEILDGAAQHIFKAFYLLV